MALTKKLAAHLQEIGNRFDSESQKLKSDSLSTIQKLHLTSSADLITLYHALLFICAYPSSSKERNLTLNCIKHLTSFLKKNKNKHIYNNTGLPFTYSRSHFSHDFLQYLCSCKYIKVNLDSYEDSLFDLNEVLKLTLPTPEKSETTAGWNNEELLQALKVNKGNSLSLIINELSKLNSIPYIKDHLFDGLGIYIHVKPNNNKFSIDQNKFNPEKIYFHNDLLKKFDHETLLNQKLPEEEKLTTSSLENYVSIIKNSMALTDRETDPVTYLDTNTLKIFHLERGISVAIYSMTGDRHLPYEIYAGYTLFKNGYPAAYGGAWVFGKRANFGINIFEWFRGGESGYIMCQLLRVYRQAFGINYFEVEPYQYGLDNPDGIKSGAFWFYYRYGFRPLDKHLRLLAEKENSKIRNNKKYKTTSKVLLSFTESNIALNLEGNIPVAVPEITTKITSFISRKFRGNRVTAEIECIANFRKKSGLNETYSNSRKYLLTEIALWCEAYNITKKNQLELMKEMIHLKHDNIYEYQKTITNFNETQNK